MGNYVSTLTPEQISLLKDVVDLAKIIIPTISTALVALIIVYLTYRFANRQVRYSKALGFKEKQITDFYSPIIGCIKKIRSHSELRVELSNAANTAWHKICDAAPHPFLDSENHFEPFKKLIEYDNIKFKKELLPLYDRMLQIFTENYWLAEESTRTYYAELCRYVDIWHRWLGETLPREILLEIEHSEERLMPFYAELEKQMGDLRRTIANK